MTNDEFNTTPPRASEPRLSADDQRLLDALAEHSFDRNALSAVGHADQRRLDVIGSTLGLLRDYPVDDADETLLHATLARIDRHEEAQAARLKFETRTEAIAAEKGGFRIRMPDFITVAAVILIGVSVCWPVLSNMKARSMELACSDNLRRVGYAFGQYAADNEGSLPLAIAGLGGAPLTWDKISNVLNLNPLVQGGYCEHNHLNCPGHHDRQAQQVNFAPTSSYSYRAFPRHAQTGWGTMRLTVVLGDLNPIVDAAHAGRVLPPLSVSLNHNGRGQNVLRSDGSSMWLEQPLLNRHDNIWLPHDTLQLHGGEEPADETDVFLTQ